MRESLEQATSTLDEVRAAISTLGGIGGAVQSIHDMNLQVASAVEQQSCVADDISRSINAIRQYSEQTLKGSEQSEQSSQSLHGQVQNLETLSQQFWRQRRPA